MVYRQSLVHGGHGRAEAGELPVLKDEHAAEDLADRQLVGTGFSRRRDE